MSYLYWWTPTPSKPKEISHQILKFPWVPPPPQKSGCGCGRGVEKLSFCQTTQHKPGNQLQFNQGRVYLYTDITDVYLYTDIGRLQFSSSKFLILSTGLPQRRAPPKIAARWRYRLPINSLKAHYNSQFCVSFPMKLCPGNPKIILNLQWFAMVCNGNPISTNR